MHWQKITGLIVLGISLTAPAGAAERAAPMQWNDAIRLPFAGSFSRRAST
jgi:hypothetical protein